MRSISIDIRDSGLETVCAAHRMQGCIQDNSLGGGDFKGLVWYNRMKHMKSLHPLMS